MATRRKILAFRGERIVVSTDVPFEEVRSRLRALMGSVTIAEIVELAQSCSSRDSFAAAVERRFVGPSGFMLFAELDHGGWLARVDIPRRTVRWIFGNPLIAETMIRHDITAGLFAPVEMLITEAEGGGGATLTYVRPSTLMVVESNPPLQAAAEALDAKVEALIERAVQTDRS
jgi:uncharacterized protein (DUF302 family)